jgi:hypothetical protein
VRTVGSLLVQAGCGVAPMARGGGLSLGDVQRVACRSRWVWASLLAFERAEVSPRHLETMLSEPLEWRAWSRNGRVGV